MLTLTQRQPANLDTPVSFTLALTASERTRSRHRFETQDGTAILLRLPRGTVLQNGDLLQAETGEFWVRVVAKPEPVLNVTSDIPLKLLRAAYHLGNRHIPLEITPHYLRLEFDPVLEDLLKHLGLEVTQEILPFQPEPGAYHEH